MTTPSQADPVREALAQEAKRLADELSMADGARSIPTGELYRSITHSQYVAKRQELHAAIDRLATTPPASEEGAPWRIYEEAAKAHLSADSVTKYGFQPRAVCVDPNHLLQLLAAPLAPKAAEPAASPDVAKTVEEALRSAFEAWYREHHGNRDFYARYPSSHPFGSDYRDPLVSGAWAVWKAAIDALGAAATQAKAAAPEPAAVQAPEATEESSRPLTLQEADEQDAMDSYEIDGMGD